MGASTAIAEVSHGGGHCSFDKPDRRATVQIVNHIVYLLNFILYLRFYMDSSLPPLLTPFGHATLLPVESFLQHVLPPLPDRISPAQTLGNLVLTAGKSPTQRSITQKGRWRGFPADPAKTKTTQRKVFRNIQNVFSAILQASGSSVAPVSFLHNSPPSQTNARRNAKSFPDLCIAHGDNTWASMLTFGELRKTSTQQDIHEVLA